MTKLTKSEQEILDKFDERFKRYNWSAFADITGGNPDESIKDFLIQAVREERERCKRIFVECVDWSYFEISEEDAKDIFDDCYEEEMSFKTIQDENE